MSFYSRSINRQSPAREFIDLSATLKSGRTDLQQPQGLWKPALAGLLVGQAIGAIGSGLLSLFPGGFLGSGLLYEAGMLGAWEALTLLLFGLSWVSYTQNRQGPKRRPMWQAMALRFGGAAVIVSALLRLSVYLFFVVDLPWSQALSMSAAMVWAPAIATTMAIGAYGAVVLKKVLGQPQGDREDRLFQILTRALPFGAERDEANLTVGRKGWSLLLPLRGGGWLSIEESGKEDPPHALRVQLTERNFHLEGVDWSGEWQGEQVSHRLFDDKTLLLSAGESPKGNAALAGVIAKILERAGVAGARRQSLPEHHTPLRLTRPQGESLPPEVPLRRAALVASIDTGFDGPGFLDAARRWVDKSLIRTVFITYVGASLLGKGLTSIFGFFAILPLHSFPGYFAAAILLAFCVQLSTRRLVPRSRRRPSGRSAHVVQKGDRLYLSDEPTCAIDLSRPFSLNLTRSPRHEASTQIAISLGQRDAETGDHNTLTFNARVQDEALIEALPELSTSAPTIDGEALGGWLWPLIRHRAGLHGLSVPWAFEGEASIQSAPAVVQAVASKAGAS